MANRQWNRALGYASGWQDWLCGRARGSARRGAASRSDRSLDGKTEIFWLRSSFSKMIQ